MLRAIGAHAGTRASAPPAGGDRARGRDSSSGSLYSPPAPQRLGGITLRFETGAVVFWSVLLFSFGLVSAVQRSSGPGHRPDRRDQRSGPMNLALRELRRRPSRFATATVILFLISLLLMFLGVCSTG
ncbi:MAG: hypothetical protein R2705_10600 [Ilumatobacteraceae bacterium]